ncbi:hypothetical protein AAG906_005914 [Vitis piasezkii]
MSPPRRDKEQMDGKEGKQKITSPKRFRGPTVKPEIAKKRSEGVKIDIQYNDDGEGVGEGYVQLVSYLGVLARTMVPVYHTDWRVVPVELKEKLWDCVKLARLKKGEYDDVTRPVAEKIDELAKAVEEGKITCVGQKDILTLALGTSEHPGRVRGKGGKKKPKQFFNTPKPTKTLEEEECQRMLREKVKSLEEEIISLKAEKRTLTPHSEVSSTNIRKQLLEHEEIRGKTHYSAHVENLSAEGTRKASPLTQVYKCKLALETKENIVAYGTYLRDSKISIDGTDILVVILYPLQPNALLPFPLSENISTIREGVGYEVLWPVAFVINDENDEDFGKRKNKMKKIQASPKKIKYENPRDIQLFSKTVSAMLEGKPAPKVDFPINVFGMKFQTFLLTTEMKDVISAKELTMNCICFYIWWLHEHLDDTLHEKIIFVHPGLVSKAGTIAPQIEKRARIIADLYYLDSLLQQPYQDIKDIVNMGFNFVSQKKKDLKRAQGPKQLDGVMCGYFVMRYMRDIIANRSLLTSQFEGKNLLTSELDEVRSEWVSFCSTLILDQVYCCNFEISRSYKLNNICSSWNFENTTST